MSSPCFLFFCDSLIAPTGQLAPPAVYLHEPTPNTHITVVDGINLLFLSWFSSFTSLVRSDRQRSLAHVSQQLSPIFFLLFGTFTNRTSVFEWLKAITLTDSWSQQCFWNLNYLSTFDNTHSLFPEIRVVSAWGLRSLQVVTCGPAVGGKLCLLCPCPTCKSHQQYFLSAPDGQIDFPA